MSAILVTHNGGAAGRAFADSFTEAFDGFGSEVERRTQWMKARCAHVALEDGWFTPSRDHSKAVLVPAFGKGSKAFNIGSFVGILGESEGYIYRVTSKRPWLTALEPDHMDVHLSLIERAPR